MKIPALPAFLVKIAVFWMAFFAFFRGWFVLWFRDRQAPGGSIFGAFYHGLRLDISTAGYLMAVPVLLWFLGVLGNQTWRIGLGKIIFYLHVALIALLILIFGANVFIYEEWNTLLNHRALQYLQSPRALIDSMSPAFTALVLILFFSLWWAWVFLYKKWIGKHLYGEKTEKIASKWWFLSIFPVLGLLILAIRGGWQLWPINESAAFYAPTLFENHAATNPAWHLMHSLLDSKGTEHHYKFADPQTPPMAEQYAAINAAPGIALLDTAFAKPNIVIVIMESHTAQVIPELGGKYSVCPTLSQLIKEGLLFDHLYGSGYRTDQGLVAVLSGYPSQPDQSIVAYIDKAQQLAKLPKTFINNGYSTLYVYGGELGFMNIGAYLNAQGFQKILSENDFPSSAKTQKWGVDDAGMFQGALGALPGLQPPFFATLMTLSLHPPYDVPWKSDLTPPFVHAANFADHAIGAFLEKAKQEPWFDQTLFVFVADHGSSQPGQIPMDQPLSRQIPLIFWGKPLNPALRGTTIKTAGNHHDIPMTLLANLHFEHTDFWGKNLLSSAANAGFAYYTNEDGMGWITPAGIGFFNFRERKWTPIAGALTENDQKTAYRFLEDLYSDFLSK